MTRPSKTRKLESETLLEDTAERLRVRKALNRAAIDITAVLDRDAVLSKAVSHAAELVRSDAAMVAMLDGERNLITFPHGVNLPPELTAATRMVGEGVAGTVIETCKPVIVNNYADYPQRREEFVGAGLTAVATVPLTSGSRCIGAIGVMSLESSRRFSEDDIEVLTIIAAQAAVAVENARLYGELAHAAERLEQRVQERTTALSRMYKESELKGSQLEQANRKLRELDRLKSEFLANMSHELRTPLNAIIGFTKLVLDGLEGEINGEQRRDLEIVHDNGKDLLGLIDDLLDLAKIEAGRTVLTRSLTDVSELIRDTVLMMKASAMERGLALAYDLPRDLKPAEIDAVKIKQTLVNLIGNAIKFTEAGDITVSVAPAEGGLLFSVADSGIGLSPEELQAAFDRFQEFSPTVAHSSSVGLGLTLCKRFVEMNGGRIWVESERGEGSTFSFFIPGRSSTSLEQRRQEDK